MSCTVTGLLCVVTGLLCTVTGLLCTVTGLSCATTGLSCSATYKEKGRWTLSNIIRVNMMGELVLFINDIKVDHLVNKSRKGVALMQLLIMHQGEPVANHRLMETLWTQERTSNPENALKTLVSRMRAILNQVYEGMGACIVSKRGTYSWQCMPGMTVDVYELDQLLVQLNKAEALTPEIVDAYNRLLKLYVGDLLQGKEMNEWVMARAVNLHNRYLTAVHKYLDMLKQDGQYDEIINVCRLGLDADAFDERMHLELMVALTKSKRNNEAMIQYKYVTDLHFRYLGVQPPASIQEFYKQIRQTGQTLDLSLDAIRAELHEHEEMNSAFVCEYVVFKEIFNLQMRNLERLGTSMFLSIIMIASLDGDEMELFKQHDVMQGLIGILKTNLRKGDTITQFSPTSCALLLPTVNYSSGNMIMERVKRKFHLKYPNSNIIFSYRIGPLSSENSK